MTTPRMSDMRRGDVLVEDFGGEGRYTFLILDSRPDFAVGFWYVSWVMTAAGEPQRVRTDSASLPHDNAFSSDASAFVLRGAP